MKTLTLLLLALLVFGTVCPAAAQNQHELNQQAERDFQRSDAELNRLWTELLSRLTPEVKEKLITSQLKWIEFRDSEAAAKASRWEGGSMAPMIYSGSKKMTTDSRVKELKLWLEDTDN